MAHHPLHGPGAHQSMFVRENYQKLSQLAELSRIIKIQQGGFFLMSQSLTTEWREMCQSLDIRLCLSSGNFEHWSRGEIMVFKISTQHAWKPQSPWRRHRYLPGCVHHNRLDITRRKSMVSNMGPVCQRISQDCHETEFRRRFGARWIRGTTGLDDERLDIVFVYFVTCPVEIKAVSSRIRASHM